MSKIKSVKHVINEKIGVDEDGEAIVKRVDRVEYEFGEEVSEDAKDHVRDHRPPLTNKQQIKDVIDSVDE